MRTIGLNAAVLCLLLSLSGCGNGTKQDIVKKTEKITTKSDLEKTLGKPDSFSKFGPAEMWTYKASDGDVVFMITGDTVQMQAAMGDGKK